MKKYLVFLVLVTLAQFAYAQPANDTCAAAENFTLSTGGNTVINTDMMNVTVNYEIGCDGTSDNYGDIWYEFTMPIDANIFINSPNSSLNYGLYNYCSAGQIQCGTGSTLFTNLVAGTNYKLRVFKSSESLSFSTNVHFGISVIETAANDDCTSAQPIAFSNIETQVDDYIMGASSLNNVENCNGISQDLLDLWFEFTMPVNGKFVITLIDTVTVINLALYDSCSGEAIQCGTSWEFSNLVAGTTYKLRLMSYRSVNGLSNSTFFRYIFPNDSCDNSINIPVSTSVLTVDYDVDVASLETSSRCDGTGFGNYADIWFDFTMPENATLIIDTRFNNQNHYELYDACGETPIRCDSIDFEWRNLTSGNYKLRLFRHESDLFEDFWDQTFKIRAVEFSPNSDCSNSETITVSTEPLVVSQNFSASTINNDIGCANPGFEEVRDLWYDFTMPLDGALLINRIPPQGPGLHHYYALYDACSGTEIDCISSYGNFYNLTMGTNYKLRFFSPHFYIENREFTIEAEAGLGVGDQILENSVTIYPNPANDYFTVSTPNNQTIVAIDCYDIFGKKVLKTTRNKEVDASTLPSGLYFVKIDTAIGSVTKKIMIQ